MTLEKDKNLKENIFFELFVIFVIVFSVPIGVKTYNGVPPQLIGNNQFTRLCNNLIFSFEILQEYFPSSVIFF